MNQEALRKLPSVDLLLSHSSLRNVADAYSHDLARYVARQAIEQYRSRIRDGDAAPTLDDAATTAKLLADKIAAPRLRELINATGIVLHTNLGRAPLGKDTLRDITSSLEGYSNLEFNLETGRRGHRADLLKPLLRFITGAQDVAIVNNNAAAVVLTLNTLASGKEVIISRGELIEIGGAFRMPDIMAASGARMKEVGTTNRTRLADYERAITEQTGLLFKAHQSNYAIAGFTEEVSVSELAALGKKSGIPVIYDIGSGLLRKPRIPSFADEPDVRGALAQGADLVTFSGDKLLGGPQAGVIAGDATLVDRCAGAPLMRALRVGKLTLAALSSACRHYLSDSDLLTKNPLYAMLEQPIENITSRAEQLAGLLQRLNLQTEIVTSHAQAGGGTLPHLFLESRAVTLNSHGSAKNQERFAETVFSMLLHVDTPVVGILREGRLLFDIFTMRDDQLEPAARQIAKCVMESGQ